jgi:hypothetical protein
MTIPDFIYGESMTYLVLCLDVIQLIVVLPDIGPDYIHE